jgi:hypothetical protein
MLPLPSGHKILKFQVLWAVTIKVTFWVVSPCSLVEVSEGRATMAVTVKITIFWDVMSYIVVQANRRFRETCCLHLQCRRLKKEYQDKSKDRLRLWTAVDADMKQCPKYEDIDGYSCWNADPSGRAVQGSRNVRSNGTQY